MISVDNDDERHYFLESKQKSNSIKRVSHRERTYWVILTIFLLAVLAFQTLFWIVWSRGNQVGGSYSKGFATDLGKSPFSVYLFFNLNLF